ncbi:SDR family NAD(P)-dependent oxidoreductase [Plantactinospora sp. WMMB334]|uniref:SDR family NAD(P)-dependent oxidoreductase n=1 Tax=Plantactinospora sp. WMMB334 TaxID=3404119 RepID=UPI003B9319C5
MAVVSVSTDQFGPWAVVTGASSGIGREFARQLAACGLNVVITGRSPVLTDIGVEIEREYGVLHRAVFVDLSKATGADRVAEATSDLDVGLLVSNAGDMVPGEFLERDLRYALESMQLNALSHVMLAHHYGKRLARRGRGGVVLVGGAGAENGMPWAATHAAAKAYTNALGRSLHTEFATRGLTLTVLTPGPTRSGLQNRRSLPQAGLMAAADCVSAALKALRAGQVEVTPGLTARILNRLPASVSRKMAGQAMMNASTSQPSAP